DSAVAQFLLERLRTEDAVAGEGIRREDDLVAIVARGPGGLLEFFCEMRMDPELVSRPQQRKDDAPNNRRDQPAFGASFIHRRDWVSVQRTPRCWSPRRCRCHRSRRRLRRLPAGAKRDHWPTGTNAREWQAYGAGSLPHRSRPP